MDINNDILISITRDLINDPSYKYDFYHRKSINVMEIHIIRYIKTNNDSNITFDIKIDYMIKGKHSFLNSDDMISKYDTLKIDNGTYIRYLRDQKIRNLGSVSQEDKIRLALSEYLEFDSDILFRSSDLVRVFGGAIRDILCGDPIHDVDILVGSNSLKPLEYQLSKQKYTYIESMTPKDLSSIYTNIHCINEPHSFMKGTKIVQVIRPSIISDGYLSDENYKSSFENLIANVDISCCGLSYDGDKLHENYPNAIIHAQSKVFSVNKKAMMYSPDRIIHRIDKLEKRGWTEIDNKTSINRDLKLDKLIN